MRRILIGMLLAGALAGPAAGARAATAEDREAYNSAVMCFVANGLAAQSRENAGDRAAAATFEANAKRSFDGAVLLARAIGLSNNQINADFANAKAREMPRMMTEQGRFRQAVADCKSIGLM